MLVARSALLGPSGPVITQSLALSLVMYQATTNK